ncbi:MAG: DUF368 domain-containing protein [Gammaproteobacteria bacterium]|nr:DUF368 domain-containing protein [Gammaproteobacteria bacterium]
MSYIGLFLRGFAMGVSDSVPGVSGGTIALVTGIYARLILALQAFDATFFLLLLKGKLRAAWDKVDGSLLSIVGVGMAFGLIVSANGILFLLSNFFEPLMGFFIGLLLSSAWLLLLALLYQHEGVLRRLDSWLAFFCGASVVFFTMIFPPLSIEFGMVNILVGGFFATGAMLLPGVSGAFVLLVFGIYEAMLSAVVTGEFLTLAVFGSGCFIGLIIFSRGIGFFLKFFLTQSYSFILGMLAASSIVLWPWQVSTIGSYGELLTPWEFKLITGNESRFWFTFIAFVVGCSIGRVLRKFSDKELQVSY